VAAEGRDAWGAGSKRGLRTEKTRSMGAAPACHCVVEKSKRARAWGRPKRGAARHVPGSARAISAAGVSGPG
jgi:hypothetical protein